MQWTGGGGKREREGWLRMDLVDKLGTWDVYVCLWFLARTSENISHYVAGLGGIMYR